MTRPLYQLAIFSRQITRDEDYNQRAPASKVREIDTLVSSINGMLGAISGAQNALRESKERLSLALKGAGEGLWDLNLDTQKLFLDKHSTAVLAMGNEDVLLSMRQLVEKFILAIAHDSRNIAERLLPTIKNILISNFG